jgi:hypothetical protein
VRRYAAGLLVAALVARGLQAAAPTAATPIIVELFTSEGCSSCPPADALLQRMVDEQPIAGAVVIALGEHVDYWDAQGWKDRFSSASLTARQQVYGNRFNLDSIYTPQVVVNGRAEAVGSDAHALRRAIERERDAPHGTMRVTVDDRSAAALAVSVEVIDLPTHSRGDRVDVVVAITEDGLRSNVTRGENHGRVLAHAPVVRHLAKIGEVPSDRITASVHAEIPIDAAWQRDHLRIVAFVQERRNRAILAAAVARVFQR